MSDIQNVRMLPRLRPRLLHHQPRHDGRHLRDPLLPRLEARADVPGVHAVPAAGDDPLQSAPEADPHGRAAEDRRRDGGGGGERGRQPHRAHLRSGGRRLEKFSDRSYKVFEASVAAASTRGRLHPAHRLHPQPRRRLPPVLRRPPGHRGQPRPRSADRLLHVPDDARVSGADHRLAHGSGAASDRERRAGLPGAGRTARDDREAGRAAAAGRVRADRGGVHRRGLRRGRRAHRLRHVRRRLVQLRRQAGAAGREPGGPGRSHRRPSSATPAAARPRSPTSCRGSTTPAPARC